MAFLLPTFPDPRPGAPDMENVYVSIGGVTVNLEKDNPRITISLFFYYSEEYANSDGADDLRSMRKNVLMAGTDFQQLYGVLSGQITGTTAIDEINIFLLNYKEGSAPTDGSPDTRLPLLNGATVV